MLTLEDVQISHFFNLNLILIVISYVPKFLNVEDIFVH